MRQLPVYALAIAALAACSPDPPPAPFAQLPRRAPSTPAGELVLALPGVAPVTWSLTAELTRGGEAVCAPAVGTVLQPVGEGRFRLLLSDPGLQVTRETVLRRTVAGPPGGAELALDGANNGRCDYLFRTVSRRA